MRRSLLGPAPRFRLGNYGPFFCKRTLQLSLEETASHVHVIGMCLEFLTAGLPATPITGDSAFDRIVYFDLPGRCARTCSCRCMAETAE